MNDIQKSRKIVDILSSMSLGNEHSKLFLDAKKWFQFFENVENACHFNKKYPLFSGEVATFRDAHKSMNIQQETSRFFDEELGIYRDVPVKDLEKEILISRKIGDFLKNKLPKVLAQVGFSIMLSYAMIKPKNCHSKNFNSTTTIVQNNKSATYTIDSDQYVEEKVKINDNRKARMKSKINNLRKKRKLEHEIGLLSNFLMVREEIIKNQETQRIDYPFLNTAHRMQKFFDNSKLIQEEIGIKKKLIALEDAKMILNNYENIKDLQKYYNVLEQQSIANMKKILLMRAGLEIVNNIAEKQTKNSVFTKKSMKRFIKKTKLYGMLIFNKLRKLIRRIFAIISLTYDLIVKNIVNILAVVGIIHLVKIAIQLIQILASLILKKDPKNITFKDLLPDFDFFNSTVGFINRDELLSEEQFMMIKDALEKSKIGLLLYRKSFSSSLHVTKALLFKTQLIKVICHRKGFINADGTPLDLSEKSMADAGDIFQTVKYLETIDSPKQKAGYLKLLHIVEDAIALTDFLTKKIFEDE